MRTIKGQNIVQDTDEANFPDGQIINETATQEGTPVVRQIYGDPLTNIYAILRSVGIEANQQEDNETNGYQLLEALKLLSNKLNDIEQLLTLSAGVWSVNLDLNILPNKYVFIAKASESYDASQTYRFKGMGNTDFSFVSSNGFNQGDNVLVVIDTSGVRATGLGSESSVNENVFTTLGNPLSYNDSNVLYYEECGRLLNDEPFSRNVQQDIQAIVTADTVLLLNMFLIEGSVLCFCYLSTTQTYGFYRYSISNNNVEAISFVGFVAPTENNQPYCYTDGNKVYITNDGGRSDLDNEIAVFDYSRVDLTLTYQSTVSLTGTFTKTTNIVVKNGVLTTLILGNLTNYNLTSGIGQLVYNSPANNGLLFQYNGNVFFSSGEVATKWNI